MVAERAQRMKPIAAFERRCGVFFVRVGGDQGRVQVDDSGCFASLPWSGACRPASRHACSRAAARAVSIAFNTAGASPASAAIALDTVGSDATRPKTPGSARSTARSARQSPPSARLSARSVMILPGSWTANGLRHPASADDRKRSSPVAVTVRVSRTPPACPTAAVADVSTRTRGYKPVIFTLKVLLELGICGPQQSTFSQVRSTFYVPHASQSPTTMKARG